ncbi:sulfatase family protein [Coraliomargarita sinensis]|uniref:sulfatase family protein n=1 Tax=Coraliomargarita sinensis TaxID=2174842 RepID=UPI001304E209|nr:sulfatase [Coraliomargarita sinensis]
MNAEERPNIVIIFLDDSGWGDFHPFGAPAYPTPNVQKLSEEGTRFNQFYVPQAVCSASRAALLSGAYPGRTGVNGAHGPGGRGLPRKFATMAEVLKKNGYATAHFGKWHIGDQEGTRPLARGFDEHAGLMYSNDMWRFHPTQPKKWGRKPLQFWENREVTIDDIDKEDQAMLTTWATEKSVDFIERKKDEPFFLYLAHSMPHVPLFCSDKFLGKSGAGLYGDVIMEIDWSVGQVNEALREAGLEENTIVIFSSDNGPWSVYGNHAGTTPFRGNKRTSFEGGTRSATIIKYPGKVKAGASCDLPLSTIDLLPTLCRLTGTQLPENEIDGKDVWPIITGKRGSENPHSYYAFSGSGFEAIISADGKWKLHLPHRYRVVVKPGKDGMPGRSARRKIKRSLFDLENDPYETKNVIGQHPAVAAKLQAIADAHKKKFWDKN